MIVTLIKTYKESKNNTEPLLREMLYWYCTAFFKHDAEWKRERFRHMVWIPFPLHCIWCNMAEHWSILIMGCNQAARLEVVSRPLLVQWTDGRDVCRQTEWPASLLMVSLCSHRYWCPLIKWNPLPHSYSTRQQGWHIGSDSVAGKKQCNNLTPVCGRAHNAVKPAGHFTLNINKAN